MKDGFLRVASATPKTAVAGVQRNIDEIEGMIVKAAKSGCGAIVFPELCVTAYTCGDLFGQRLLIEQAERGVEELIKRTEDLDILCVVGAPVHHMCKLYNCAVAFHRGRLLGLVPKSFIPGYSEFYETRYFSGGQSCCEAEYAGQRTFLGTDLIFSCENVLELEIGIEICEDLWSMQPPSVRLARNGASVILNLSCSDEVIGKEQYRRDLVKMHSGRILAGYVYADSGRGESTTDMVFAGHDIIAENGEILAESRLFTTGIIIADIDLQRISHERSRVNTWTGDHDTQIRRVTFAYDKRTIKSYRPGRVFEKYPFVPSDAGERDRRCQAVISMQAQGLCTRLEHIGCKEVVLGVSGGLDSTLALLVAVRAFDELGLTKSGIHAISMPCFGTTDRTRGNAQRLAQELKIKFSQIPIDKAVMQHFQDIGKDPSTHDVVFENAQARERTQVLMDVANQSGAIVIGTGDLSELALGWATYNGDHMSMYAVNSSVPKTLVRHLVYSVARESEPRLSEILRDILETPVSPELLPAVDGEIAQKTEELIGPYELHDFFLYYILRFGFTPEKIFNMSCSTFEEEYPPEVIKKWMRVFYSRFFSQQFKRSCMPDGPKIGSVTLSPRGDFKMPSDACADLWIAQLEQL